MSSLCPTEATPSLADEALEQAALVSEFRALVGDGRAFARLREQVAVSQREIAKWIPADPRTVRKFERNERMLRGPQLARVIEFARAAKFGVLAR